MVVRCCLPNEINNLSQQHKKYRSFKLNVSRSSIHSLAVTVLFPGKGAEVDRLSVSAKDGVCCLENDQLYRLRGYLTH